MKSKIWVLCFPLLMVSILFGCQDSNKAVKDAVQEAFEYNHNQFSSNEGWYFEENKTNVDVFETENYYLVHFEKFDKEIDKAFREGKGAISGFFTENTKIFKEDSKIINGAELFKEYRYFEDNEKPIYTVKNIDIQKEKKLGQDKWNDMNDTKVEGIVITSLFYYDLPLLKAFNLLSERYKLILKPHKLNGKIFSD